MIFLAQTSPEAWSSTALAWFILFLIALAILLWFLYWLIFPDAPPVAVSKSLEGLDGMNESMAGRLAKYGIRSDHDLIRLTSRGQQELESQLGLHNGEYDGWRQQVLNRWRVRYLPIEFREVEDITPDPELGGIYTRRPKEVDDLTKLSGIDKNIASRMNHAGIYTFEQLRLLTPEQKACCKRRFNLSGFDFHQVPQYGVTAQWLKFLREGDGAGSKSSGSTGMGLTSTGPNGRTGVNSGTTGSTSTSTPGSGLSLPTASGPEVDWNKVEGVEPRLAAELKSLGIKNVAQLQAMSPQQRSQLEASLKSKGLSWNWGWLTNWKTGLGAATAAATASFAASKPSISGTAPSVKLDLPTVSGPEVDWSKVDGVDARLGAELKSLGIKNVDQLQAMSPQQRSQLEASLKSKGLSWDWGWLTKWKTGLGSAAAATGAAATSFTKPTVSASAPTVKLDLPKATGPEVDWSKLDGVDPRLAAELKSLGIQNVDQMQSMTWQQRSQLEASLKSKGLSWDWSWLTKWKQPSANLKLDLPSVSGPEVDWSKVEGVDPRLAAEFKSMGIKNVDQLQSLTWQQRSQLEASLKSKGLSWDWSWLAKWKNSLGAKASGPLSTGASASFTNPTLSTPSVNLDLPSVSGPSIDWSGLQGVDPRLAGELKSLGIKNVDQLEAMSGDQRAELNAHLRRKGLDWDWRWLKGWRTGSTSSASTASSGSTASSSATSTTNLGFQLPSVSGPEVDWGKEKGVDPRVAAEFKSLGIKNKEQLEALSPQDRAKLDARLKEKGLSWDWGWLLNWKTGLAAAAASGAAALGFGGKTKPTPEESSQKEYVAQSQGQASAKTEIPKSSYDSMLGRVYTSPPPHQDDLTNLKGIDAAAAAKLNEAGVYRFDQILSLNPVQRAHFKQRFQLPHFEFDGNIADTVAKSTTASVADPGRVVTGFAAGAAEGSLGISSGGSASSVSGTSYSGTTASSGSVAGSLPGGGARSSALVESPLGNIYSSPPADADNLSALPGIDEATAKRLNAAGIYKYEQLDGMTLAQQAKLRSQFGLGNIDFSEWKRLIYAWSRGLKTQEQTVVAAGGDRQGWLHSVRLPVLAPGVFDGQQLVAYPEQVVFRGTNPEAWGQEVTSPRSGVDKSIGGENIRNDINYVRIRRTDTRESVVVPISKSHLFTPGPESGGGWNGLCERYFDARHLGAFAQGVPTEVETKFGFGGWGFGHQVDKNDSQEFCWNGRLIPPTVFEISVGRIGALPGTVVFRSDDPRIWNKDVPGSSNHFAKELASVSHPISFVRIMRTDTGEAVIARTDKANVTKRADNPQVVGWNGLNEHFFGGHHLGAYFQKAPQDVEIAYGEGGWGFGHVFDDNDRQAFGWAGKPIPKTIFEITVLATLPEHLRHELLE